MDVYLDRPLFRSRMFVGALMNRVLYPQTFRFIHTASGDYIDVPILGEASDVGDKASNKAMTAALKYALRQTFLIETGDDPDKHPSGEQERAEVEKKNSRNWKPEKIKCIVDEGLAQNRNHALGILNKSILPIGARKATIISWVRHYRGSRDNGLLADEATNLANTAYLEAKKQAKSKKKDTKKKVVKK